jgi:hypothetical protein
MGLAARREAVSQRVLTLLLRQLNGFFTPHLLQRPRPCGILELAAFAPTRARMAGTARWAVVGPGLQDSGYLRRRSNQAELDGVSW